MQGVYRAVVSFYCWLIRYKKQGGRENFVTAFATAFLRFIEKGRVGEVYNLGGVKRISFELGEPESLITHVAGADTLNVMRSRTLRQRLNRLVTADYV